MVISERDLECGCHRINTDAEDEALSDEQVHAGHEKNMVNWLSDENALNSSALIAQALTWFYRHDDVRGIEALRKMPHERVTWLVRKMRALDPNDEYKVEGPAIAAALRALGFAPPK